MSNENFLFYIPYAFNFFTDIVNRFLLVFQDHPWLCSLLIAPLIVAMVIFGVSLSVSLVNKNSAGKGER